MSRYNGALISLVTVILVCGMLGVISRPTDPRGLSPADARRLSSLDPDRPETYLLVGEWLARDDASRDLARETLATGALVAMNRAEPDPRRHANRIAGSLIVALAAIESDASASRGLWMLALSIDPSRAESFRWMGGLAERADEQRAAAARVLGLLRRGDPDVLRDMTDEHRTTVLDEALAMGLDAGRISAIVRSWQRSTQADPCEGRHFVRVREGDRIVASPCPRPEFHHGSVYSDDWAAMVAIELSLAGHTPASWPIRGAIGLDRPVPMWTLDRLAQTYGVSASRPIHRAGSWVER